MIRSGLTGLLFFCMMAVIPSFGQGDRCVETARGPAIDWKPDLKLEWSDFRAGKKGKVDESIAASTCGFGFDGIARGDEVLVNVFVRFYCEDSWRDPKYDGDGVLAHEQLHFDICELYGRKLYQAISRLRAEGRLNEKNLKKFYDSLVIEYDRFQDKYDLETNHSTLEQAQQKWNTRIARELAGLEKYAAYSEY